MTDETKGDVSKSIISEYLRFVGLLLESAKQSKRNPNACFVDWRDVCALRGELETVKQAAQSAMRVDEAPLAGDWRYNNGYLCCGTFRVMAQDWEAGVCSAGDMRNDVGKWIARTLNNSTGNIDSWVVADKVRRELDKQSCPDHWMRVAFEAFQASLNPQP